MGKRLPFCLMLFVLCILLLCGFAAAQTEFLFELADGVDASAAAEAEPVSEEHGVFVTDDAALIRQLRQENALEYYEENGSVSLQSLDGELAELKKDDWKRSMLGWSYANGRKLNGKGVRVGIIDSGLAGCFSEHSDAVIEPGHNYIDPESDTDDSYGHGTFVASVLAHGECGLACGVTIVPLKAFEEKNSKVANICSAIYEAVDKYHCDVLNMSFAATSDFNSLREAIEYAVGQGVIVVAAAGNISKTVSAEVLRYPAAYDGVFGVSSVDVRKTVAGTSARNAAVSFCAPGEGVTGMNISGSLYTNNGTSFSAPVITAAAAIALQADPDMSFAQLSALLCRCAEDIGAPGRDDAYGEGLVNFGLLAAVLTKDYESVIPTVWDGHATVFAASENDPTTRLIAAFYDARGQLLRLQFADCAELRGAAVPELCGQIKLLTVRKENLAPLKETRS